MHNSYLNQPNAAAIPGKSLKGQVIFVKIMAFVPHQPAELGMLNETEKPHKHRKQYSDLDQKHCC